MVRTRVAIKPKIGTGPDISKREREREDTLKCARDKETCARSRTSRGFELFGEDPPKHQIQLKDRPRILSKPKKVDVNTTRPKNGHEHIRNQKVELNTSNPKTQKVEMNTSRPKNPKSGPN